MKTKFLLPLCISVVMGAMVFISCEHEQNYSESIQNEEVNQFLQSSYGKDFLENINNERKRMGKTFKNKNNRT